MIKVWLIGRGVVEKGGSVWSYFWREQISNPRKDVSARVKGRRFSASACSRALRAGAGRHAEPVRQLAASDVSGEHAADASGRGGGIPARRRRVRATREPVADVQRSLFRPPPRDGSRGERLSSTAPRTSAPRAPRVSTRARLLRASLTSLRALFPRLAAPRCSCPGSRPRALPCPTPWTACSPSSWQTRRARDARRPPEEPAPSSSTLSHTYPPPLNLLPPPAPRRRRTSAGTSRSAGSRSPSPRPPRLILHFFAVLTRVPPAARTHSLSPFDAGARS